MRDHPEHKTPIRILIVDDHEIVRRGLRAVVDIEPDMALVGEAADGNEAIAMARALRPDIILLDLVMPRKDGLAAICEIKQDNPEARILVLTSFAENDRIVAAIRAGALGYVLKDSLTQELLDAIRTVHRGKPSLDPTLAFQLVHDLDRPSSVNPIQESLSEREVDVLKLLAEGLSNRGIADKLTVSERTIAVHVSKILNKLHLANRTQAVLYALRHRLVSLD